MGNFRGKSEKAPKINFRGFKFRGSNQFRGVVPGTSDDVTIHTLDLARDLLQNTWINTMR